MSKITRQRAATPELAQVIGQLALARPGKLTLQAVRAALREESTHWAADGELLHPQDRTSLLIELDELIEQYGAGANAPGLAGVRR